MTSCNEPDEWLMGQVALGKREYLEKLIRRYAAPLLTFIQRSVSDRQRSEDLFQESFLAVWTKRHLYKFPKPFKSWLFAIAINKCRAEFRKRRPATPIAVDEDLVPASASGDSSPAELAIHTETATLVAAAVARLPQQQRTVVVLRVWNNLSYAQIAETLGKTEATVRSHMHHALASMRRHLEPRLREA